jgi:hypothetical protein
MRTHILAGLMLIGGSTVAMAQTADPMQQTTPPAESEATTTQESWGEQPANTTAPDTTAPDAAMTPAPEPTEQADDAEEPGETPQR